MRRHIQVTHTCFVLSMSANVHPTNFLPFVMESWSKMATVKLCTPRTNTPFNAAVHQRLEEAHRQIEDISICMCAVLGHLHALATRRKCTCTCIKMRVANRHGTPHTEHKYNTVAIAKIGSSKSAFHVGSHVRFCVSVLYVTAPAAEMG